MKKTHGLSKTRFYGIWNDMMMRCYNPNKERYNCYGGRGIKVCERWKIFDNFKKDMIDQYKAGLSIERINVNGNYEPQNCKWIPIGEQKFNKQLTKKITVLGVEMTPLECSLKYDVNIFTIYKRIKLGYKDEELIKGRHMKILFNNEYLTFKEISEKINVKEKTIRERIRTRNIAFLNE